MTNAFAVINRVRLSWLEANPRIWQRCLIICAVLLLSVVAAQSTSLMFSAMIIALPTALVIVATLLQRPWLGPIILIITGLVANIGFSDNFNPTVLLLVLLCGLCLFNMIARKQQRPAKLSRTTKALFLLVGVALFAFLVGQLQWFPVPSAPLEAQIGGVAVFVLSAGAFLMVAGCIKELRWLKWMVWVFIVLASVYVMSRILPRPFSYFGRFYPWGSTSCLFWLWLSAHLFSQLLLNRSLGIAHRTALAMVLVATLYCVIVQTYDWKSGWIPVLVVMMSIVALRWPRLALIGAIGGLIVAPFIFAELISTDEYSYSTRIDAWRIMLQIIQTNPIFGMGPSNYYWYTPLFAIRGYEVNFNSHNQYIDLVAQTGIVGLLCYLYFFWAVAKVGWRLRHRVPEGFAHAYLYGALGGLCTMLVAGLLGDWILPFVYNVGLVGMRSSILGWLFLGGIMTLDRLYGNLSSDKHVLPRNEWVLPQSANTQYQGRQLDAAVPYK